MNCPVPFQFILLKRSFDELAKYIPIKHTASGTYLAELFATEVTFVHFIRDILII